MAKRADPANAELAREIRDFQGHAHVDPEATAYHRPEKFTPAEEEES